MATGEPLRNARKAAGLSLAGMAALVGHDKGNLSKIEHGKAHPHTIELWAGRYERALGVDGLVEQCQTLPPTLVTAGGETAPFHAVLLTSLSAAA